MGRDFAARRRRPRWGVVLAVCLLHLALLAALVRAFAPQFADTVARSVTTAFSIDLPPPEKLESEAPPVAAEPDPAPAGAAGRKARPRDAAVPEAPVAVRPTQAPPVAGEGQSDASGAAQKGPGSGAAGAGTGPGAGGAGSGQGGGGTPTVKLSGNINSASDYPRKTRELRIGSSVTIDLRVGTDGRVRACTVVAASPDPTADRITCELATRRFRFRPATNGAGEAVEAVYRWRQRWFY